jgi:hypothetical protein
MASHALTHTPLRRFDELRVLWAAAVAEANLALDAWRDMPGRDGYASWRAAEDRADAAQDELALFSR